MSTVIQSPQKKWTLEILQWNVLTGNAECSAGIYGPRIYLQTPDAETAQFVVDAINEKIERDKLNAFTLLPQNENQSL